MSTREPGQCCSVLTRATDTTKAEWGTPHTQHVYCTGTITALSTLQWPSPTQRALPWPDGPPDDAAVMEALPDAQLHC